MWYPVVRVVRASPALERSSRVEPLTERVTPVTVAALAPRKLTTIIPLQPLPKTWQGRV